MPIFKTQLRSVFPGPPIYFTDFIFCMVISYFSKNIQKKLQVSNAKSKGIFFQKKSWSQMIQNCLIRREMAKKNFAADGGFRRQLL